MRGIPWVGLFAFISVAAALGQPSGWVDYGLRITNYELRITNYEVWRGCSTLSRVGDGSQPDDITEVRIGWFGPTDPDHPQAGAMWQAATLAIEEANQAGGYRGLPFRLVAAWSENPWGTGVKGVTQLVYDEKVWPIVGAPDGPSAHLVEQIVAKARLVFINPVSTDGSANMANVPWIFSCAPSDHLLASPLADAIVSKIGDGGFSIVSCTDHDSRRMAAELLAALRQREVFPDFHLEFKPHAAEFQAQLQRLRKARSLAVAVIADAEDAARFTIAMRRAGLKMAVFGGPAMGHRLFAATAGQAAAGVVFPALWNTSATGERSATFARSFHERFGDTPDYTAAHTYDAVTLLIAAIRKAGLNRARIGDTVRELSPWLGVTGTITWDATGQNHRPVGVIGEMQNAECRIQNAECKMQNAE